MARALHSYADAVRLDERALLRIVRSGDPVDRLLACWRLMVRGQGIAVDPTTGPDPGARRLLLLNLAVGKKIDLLELLATLDPDPVIRREAVVWLWRIDPKRGLQRIRDRIVHEPDEAALLDLLADLPPEPWAALVGELEALHRHPGPGVRERVASLLSSWHRFSDERPSRSPTDRAPTPDPSPPTVPWDLRNAPRPAPDTDDRYLRRLYNGWCENWSRRCRAWCETLERSKPSERLLTHRRCDRCGFRFVTRTTNYSLRPSADVYNRGTCCNPDCRHEWDELS